DNAGKPCEIWAIGGGKGGTGKSFITSSMATCLAMKGNRVVLIDADLGGANLHTFLGVNRPKYTLTDFFEKKVPLRDIVVHSGIFQMGLVSGALSSLDSESINHAQKQKLFRHIRALDTDYILIDLGAGSHNNTIDTFLLADKMLVVTVPEITALENTYHFIKNVFFRRLKNVFGSYGLKEVVMDTWKNRDIYGIRTLKELIDYLKGISSEVREIVEKDMAGFLVHIVLNQLRQNRDIVVGENVKSVCLKFLGLNALYGGHIQYDQCLSNCINKRQPFMTSCRFSATAREIEALTNGLLNGKMRS
ncbi:MAG TPA: P-loop NTPase, partial [Thermodesulfovibrionales bacterium]|nr:P-loop NTPase [Thermodesulfovibrionales bacterium]